MDPNRVALAEIRSRRRGGNPGTVLAIILRRVKSLPHRAGGARLQLSLTANGAGLQFRRVGDHPRLFTPNQRIADLVQHHRAEAPARVALIELALTLHGPAADHVQDRRTRPRGKAPAGISASASVRVRVKPLRSAGSQTTLAAVTRDRVLHSDLQLALPARGHRSARNRTTLAGVAWNRVLPSGRL